jgi:hypothetical protein
MLFVSNNIPIKSLINIYKLMWFEKKIAIFNVNIKQDEILFFRQLFQKTVSLLL